MSELNARGSVLFVWGNGSGVGGTEARMAEVSKYLTDSGVECTSFMWGGSEKTRLADLLRRNGSSVLASSTLSSIARISSRTRPGYIMTFGLRASLGARLLKLLRRGAMRGPIVDARNGLEAYRPIALWWVDRLTQKMVDVFLANSDAVADELRTRGINAGRIKVLYSSIDSKWRSSACAPRDPLSVAMIGNARPEKRHRLALDAFAAVRQNATLFVYTDDAEDLKRYWDGLDQSGAGRVEFVEGHSVTPEDLDRVAIVLHTSSHESAPRALMEARSRGCFVIATDAGDVRRIVGPDGGIVTSTADRQELTKNLESSLELSAHGLLSHERARFPVLGDYVDGLSGLAGVSRKGGPQ